MSKFVIMEPAGKKLFRAPRTPTFNTRDEAAQYLAECPSLEHLYSIKEVRG